MSHKYLGHLDKSQLCLRVTPEYKRLIEERAKVDGMLQARWVKRALDLALALGNSPSMLEQVLSRFDALEERLAQISNQLNASSSPAAPATPVQQAAKQPPRPLAHQAELAELFNALCEKLGDSEVELRLNVAMASDTIDIWIPERNLALILAVRGDDMSLEEVRKYEKEVDEFSPGACVMTLDNATLSSIAADILSNAPIEREPQIPEWVAQQFTPQLELEPEPEPEPKPETPDSAWLEKRIREEITSLDFIAQFKETGFKASTLCEREGLVVSISNVNLVRAALAPLIAQGKVKRGLPKNQKEAARYYLK